MIALSIKSVKKEKGLFFLLVLVGVIGGVFAFIPSYFSNLNVIIGLCLVPLILTVNGPKRNNFFYIVTMLLFAALTVMYGLRICYFFTLAFYFLWLFELFVGRLNVLILFLLGFMSPVFIQVVTILGFPIRLMLSDWAGQLLNLVGVSVQVEGNMMMLNGEMFTVDEACMGLNMLAISMLMGAFVLGYRYRVSKTFVSIFPTTIFFLVAFILNMITNLIRIIVLVFFRIPPENPMHEFIGVLCLVAYVVIPLHFFSAWLVNKYGRTNTDSIWQQVFGSYNIALITIIPMIILSVGITLKGKKHFGGITHADIHFNRGQVEKLNDGITKLSTDDLLIYVKPIPEFFTGEHTPLMCWKGSGYRFAGIKTTEVDGIPIYRGTLVKDGTSLYTAWWYSNGEVETISQLDWRLRMLKGEPNFCLVNVSAEDEQILMNSIKSIFWNRELVIK